MWQLLTISTILVLYVLLNKMEQQEHETVRVGTLSVYGGTKEKMLLRDLY